MKSFSFALLLLLPLLFLKLRVLAKPVFSISEQFTADQVIDRKLSPSFNLTKLPLESISYVNVDMTPKKDSFTLAFHLSTERDPETNDPIRKKAVSILVGGAKTFMSPIILQYMRSMTARDLPYLQSDFIMWDYPGKNMNRKNGKFSVKAIKASLVALIKNMAKDYDIINVYGVCFGAGPVLETLSEHDLTNLKPGFKINAYIIAGYSSKEDFDFDNIGGKDKAQEKAIDYFIRIATLQSPIGKLVRKNFWFDPIKKINNLTVDDIFIIHGEKDDLINVKKMEDFAAKLQDMGHSVYYHEAYQGEHNLHPLEDVAQYLEILELTRNYNRRKAGDNTYVTLQDEVSETYNLPEIDSDTSFEDYDDY